MRPPSPAERAEFERFVRSATGIKKPDKPPPKPQAKSLAPSTPVPPKDGRSVSREVTK